MSENNFTAEPFNQYVIVKPFPPDTVTTGGLIIPITAQERMSKATLVALGEELENKKAKIGDTVFHVKGAGTLIEHDKEEYYIMRYTDLLCKL